MVEVGGNGVDAAPEVHVVGEPEHVVLVVAGQGEAVKGITPQRVALTLTQYNSKLSRGGSRIWGDRSRKGSPP